MNSQIINKFYLIYSDNGYVNILEHDIIDKFVYHWSIEKCFSDNDYPNEIVQDAEYINNGDYLSVSMYFDNISEYIEFKYSSEKDKYTIIHLGYFKNIYECRKFVIDIYKAIKIEKMYNI